MKPIHISSTATSTGSPALLFTLLKDGTTWPSWSLFDSFELERPGRQEPHGAGAIRVLRTKVSMAREEIIDLVPNQRLSYKRLSGFPFRDYCADVDLEVSRNMHTNIRWRAKFYSKYWGTGWFWRLS